MRVLSTALLAAILILFTTTAQAKRRARVLRMKATAFSQEAKPTASGTVPHEGIVAADPNVLPMGTRIRVTGAGPYNGVYVVTDKGRRISGPEIDIYLASDAEAKRFGKKTVQVRILDEGEGRRDARRKDPAGAAAAEPAREAARSVR